MRSVILFELRGSFPSAMISNLHSAVEAIFDQ